MKAYTLTLAAGASQLFTQTGSVVTVKSCNLPLTVVFDGCVTDTLFKSGRVIKPLANGFKVINLSNPNSVAVTTTFYVADAPVTYSADDNSSANAQTQALGNLGIGVSAAAANGLPACDANGYLQITNAMQLVLTGLNNGHRRQMITFSISPNSPAPLNILDAAGNAFITMAAGSPPIALPTDSAFILSGAGGTAWVTVGQIFLTS